MQKQFHGRVTGWVLRFLQNEWMSCNGTAANQLHPLQIDHTEKNISFYPWLGIAVLYVWVHFSNIESSELKA